MGMAVGRESLHETTEPRPLRSLTNWGTADRQRGEPAITYKDAGTNRAQMLAHGRTWPDPVGHTPGR
jgi:hypothetical protein